MALTRAQKRGLDQVRGQLRRARGGKKSGKKAEKPATLEVGGTGCAVGELANVRRNALVVLTSWPPPGAEAELHGGHAGGGQARALVRAGSACRLMSMAATADPSDRAHVVKYAGKLAQAATLNGHAKPRRYPENQMTSRGVSHDSAFDEMYRLQQELEGIPGIGLRDTRGRELETVFEERCRAGSMLGTSGLRAATHRRW